MAKLFGTDGVRGVANKDLGFETAYRLGRSGAYVLKKDTSEKVRILIAKDTRLSGDLLEASLVAGICSIGADAHLAGILPTPGLAYLVKKHGYDAGIMISASHNPMEDNGIKFFDQQGYKLDDETEEKIEKFYALSDKLDFPMGEKLGKRSVMYKAYAEYKAHLLESVNHSFSGMHILLDCANGSASYLAPDVFQTLHATVTVLHNKPNGTNINHQCGSTYPKELMKKAKEKNYDIALAFDGDADRVIALDENGNLLNGDHILAILALYYKEKNLLRHHGVVGTVMSNLGFKNMAKEQGLHSVYADVGDRYVLKLMQEHDFILGGEQSGHIILHHLSTTGDGILAALQLVSILRESGKKLSELASVVKNYPQIIKNAKVPSDKKAEVLKHPAIQEEIAKYNTKYQHKGNFLIRPSGTQSMIRIMIEGENESEIESDANSLKEFIEQQFS